MGTPENLEQLRDALLLLPPAVDYRTLREILATFGGEEPETHVNALSWDKARVLIERGSGELEIVARPRERVLFACAYLTGQCYGGPEEGGWYYESGRHLMSLPFVAIESADLIAIQHPSARLKAKTELRRLCEIAGFDVEKEGFAIDIDDKPGQDYPTETPRYE